MYKTLYSYQSSNESVLTFPDGKNFNLIEQLDEHWWSMQDEFGNYGLIPASYLEVNQLCQEDVLRSIKRSIDAVKKIAESHGRDLNETERRNLLKLHDSYETIKQGNSLWSESQATSNIPQQPKRQAPKVPQPSTPPPSGSSKRGKSTKRYSAPPPPQREISINQESNSKTPETSAVTSKVYNIQVSSGDASPLQTKDLTSPSSTDTNNRSCTKVTSIQGKNLTITKTESFDDDSKSISDQSTSDSFVSSSASTLVNLSNSLTIKSDEVPSTSNMNYEASEGFGKELVDDVRSRCKISFNKALAAVRCVLQGLGKEVPAIHDITRSIQKQIQDERLNVYRGSLANEDAQRLYGVLDQLTEHKDDSQQRNWAVHEDYTEIKSLLEEVVKIIDEIDPSVSKEVLKDDECRYINDLILLYQMENRPKLRVALLHLFGCCCQLGEEFVSTLLCSVLPIELAQDIMQDQSDLTKFLTTTLMLTMVFSTGESVPYHHYVQFNDDFVDFVLNTIEDPPDNDIDDQISDTLIGMLLSFNQHFKAPISSTLIQVLRKRTNFRTLTEKILLLLNRETDPVALFDFVHPCPDSVLKFLIDVFSTKETSEMFFTNDLYVLYDIILRQLVNREEKDKVRTEYLSLFHSMLNTTDYASHKRHASEFKRRLSEILHNEENESEVDIYIVHEILNRFGSIL